ncbi:MAG: murein transglycosylase A [Burkholderiales bacterium]|nr:murein transglycosylase A [Burkholderiales bacterium]
MIRDARAAAAALALLAALLLGACASPPKETQPRLACPAATCPACPFCPAAKPEVPPAPPLAPASYQDLPGWAQDDLTQVWEAFLRSCRALRMRDSWVAACGKAAEIGTPTSASIRAYLEANFTPYRVTNPDGTTEGRITGYYEPLLNGSRERRPPFIYPLYAPPDDLLVIDLASVAPDTRGMRLRGRLEGRRVVPYYSRAEIERGLAPVTGKEIVFVDDPIEAFFLQIQGSGRVRLPTGEMLRIGYADQNGHPYASIGRYLVDEGELPLAQASMQGIQAWARANPGRVAELLAQNPSYVFFRELPPGSADEGVNGLTAERGPPGALGVPLTAERSIAVDRRFVPLGAPVYLATTRPSSEEPLERLVMAQDTGGAIRGAVRADFFWGTGPDAGRLAGRMRQTGRMWVLLPNGYPLPANGGR